MARIMWTSMQCGLCRASTCCGTPCGMKIRSIKCRSHQRFAERHMMSTGFQNDISQLEKKIRRSLLVVFHSFCNLKYSLQKFFFNVDTIKLVAYAEQLLLRNKAAVCCPLLCSIVWMHHYQVNIEI